MVGYFLDSIDESGVSIRIINDLCWFTIDSGTVVMARFSANNLTHHARVLTRLIQSRDQVSKIYETIYYKYQGLTESMFPPANAVKSYVPFCSESKETKIP